MILPKEEFYMLYINGGKRKRTQEWREWMVIGNDDGDGNNYKKEMILGGGNYLHVKMLRQGTSTSNGLFKIIQ